MKKSFLFVSVFVFTTGIFAQSQILSVGSNDTMNNNERGITTVDSWLSMGMGVSTNEGDGGEIDYVHINNVRNSLLAK
jgi:hypothetical protein